MPVGTHGVVRGLSAGDVRRTGAQIILATPTTCTSAPART